VGTLTPWIKHKAVT